MLDSSVAPSNAIPLLHDVAPVQAEPVKEEKKKKKKKKKSSSDDSDSSSSGSDSSDSDDSDDDSSDRLKFKPLDSKIKTVYWTVGLVELALCNRKLSE